MSLAALFRISVLLPSAVSAVVRFLGPDAPAVKTKASARLSDFVEVIESTAAHKLPDGSFGSCAIVGSSSVLDGQRHGADIDSHDTVIRVNRLPTTQYFADFGKRTDVLFGNYWEAGHGMVTLMGPASKNCSHAKGAVECDTSIRCDQGGPMCSFSTLIVKMRNASPSTRKYMSRRWAHAPYPVASAKEEVFDVAGSLLPGVDRPSAGFVAFLTFAPLCRTLKVFGFAGRTTADGHPMATSHNFDLEHSVLALLSRGMAPTEAGPAARAWVRRFLAPANITVVPA